MPDFEHSTLWRISSFDEMRERDGESPTLLPTTLLSDLNQLQRDPSNDDVLGSPTLLVFWHPRCGFCQSLLPELVRWAAERSPSTPKPVLIATGEP